MYRLDTCFSSVLPPLAPVNSVHSYEPITLSSYSLATCFSFHILSIALICLIPVFHDIHSILYRLGKTMPFPLLPLNLVDWVPASHPASFHESLYLYRILLPCTSKGWLPASYPDTLYSYRLAIYISCHQLPWYLWCLNLYRIHTIAQNLYRLGS